MPRTLYTPSTRPIPSAPSSLRLFIQAAQLDLVYSRRREQRLPLHDSFRLTLGARHGLPPAPPVQLGTKPGGLPPTIYLGPEAA